MSGELPNDRSDYSSESIDNITRYARDTAYVRDYVGWMMSFREYLSKEFEYSELDIDQIIVESADNPATYLPTPEDFLCTLEDGLDKARAHLITEIIPLYDAIMYERALASGGRLDKKAYCDWYDAALSAMTKGEDNRHDNELCQPCYHETYNAACDFTELCPLKVLIKQLDEDLLSYPLDDGGMETMSLMPDGIGSYINIQYDRLKCQIVTMEARGLLPLDQARSRLTAATAGRDSMLEYCEERAAEFTSGSDDMFREVE